jgi:chemotaxis signal transduction protein
MTPGDGGSHIVGVAALRWAFDSAFVLPPRVPPIAEAVLSVRVGKHPFIVRVADLAGLRTGLSIETLPSAMPEFLGVASLRGAIVPVYDLARLLGRERSANPRWFALAAGAGLTALAFDAVEGHLSLEASQSIDTDVVEGSPLRGGVRIDGILRRVIHIPGVLTIIAERALAATLPKER